MFSVIVGGQLNKLFLEKKTEERKVVNSKKIVFLFFSTLVGIAVLAIVGSLLFGKSERSEWFVYESASIMVFIVTMWVARKRHMVNEKLEN
jgi:L-asparagine transporter-like permease